MGDLIRNDCLALLGCLIDGENDTVVCSWLAAGSECY
jgi:hypothetical protein